MRAAVTKITTALFCLFALLTSAKAALPLPPQNLQYAWLSWEVLLTWDEVPDATSYNVYRYDATNTTWAAIATGVTVPRYRDSGIYEPQNYTVRAVNADGESLPAPPVAAHDSGDWLTINLNQYNWSIYDTVAMFPITVDLLAGADAMLEVGLTWSNLTHFTWDTNYTTLHHLTITNLAPGTHYFARITCVSSNRNGTSGWFDFTTYPTNRPPIPQEQTYTTYEDAPIPLQIWLSAWDPDGMFSITKTVVSGPSHGTLVQSNEWGLYLYTPDTNFFGTDSFTFVASDGQLTSQPATITIDVWGFDDPPQPLDQTVTTPEDTQLTITVQANDVEGDAITTVQFVTWPSNGWAWAEGPNVFYMPRINTNGDDSFTFTVCDSGGACSWYWYPPATVLIHITPVNDAPEARDASVVAHAEATGHGNFLVSDLDGDPVTCEVTSTPASGVVTVSGTNFTYTPNPGSGIYFGDSFRYRASDGQTNGNEATVWVWVGNTNTVPVANDQTVTVVNNRDWWFNLDVVDPDYDPSQIILVAGPTNGTIQFYGLGAYYHSASNYVGPDSFSYQVFDGTATGNVATVTLDVIANRAPVADNLAISLPEDATIDFGISGSDPDGDSITFTRLSNVAHGTLTEVTGTWPYFYPPGSYRYQPTANFNGTDSFTFTVSDGISNGNVATVSITITPVNDPPVVSNNTVTTTANTPLNLVLGASDIDGDVLTYNIIPPTNGVLSGTAPNLTFTPNTDWTGTNILRFRVNDGTVWSAFATVTIVVTPMPNRPPVAQNQSVTVVVNTPLAITLGASDPDGQALTFAIVNNPLHGSLSGSGANRTYTPVANYLGSDSFKFRVTDPFGLSATGTVSITVFQPNRAPVGQNTAYNVPEDWVIAFGIFASDADGDPVTYRIVTPPAHGTLSIPSYQNLIYRGFTNYNGQDSFTWVANDGHVDSALYTVTMNVTPMNDTPTATNQTVNTPEDTPVTIAPQAGDVDGGTLTFVVSVQPAHGSVSVNGGAFVYNPATNFNGTDWFQYQARDSSNAFATATITVVVSPVGDPPAANAASVTTPEDTAKSITLSGSDPDGETLTYAIVSGPSHGTLAGTLPSLSYTPAANFNGSDSFDFRVTDPGGNSSTATITITVTAVNDVPVANGQSLAVIEDTPTPFSLLGSDADGDVLTSSIATQPSHGSLALQDGSWLYVPVANYHGPDSFTFTVSDGSVSSSPATVSVTVSSVNDVPTADSQSVATDEDTPANITLAGSDIDGDSLAFTVVAGPAHGTLSGSAPNLVYTPAPNFHGDDSFTFTVSDGSASSSPATVSITVLSVNDAPTANSQSVATDEDIPANITLAGSDLDGDSLIFNIMAGPVHGTLSGSPPNLVYTPGLNFHGADSFTFTVSDGSAGSAPATVSITVSSVNDAPTADAQSLATDEDTSATVTLGGSDNDGDPLTFSLVAGPAHGTLVGTAPNLTYTPAANYNGPDSFTFKVGDGNAESAPAVVTINVAAVNDAPAANAGSVIVAEDSVGNVPVTVSDADGDSLSPILVTAPAHGAVGNWDGQSWTYLPNANYNGPDSFTFQVTDGSANSSPVTVAITVTPVNDVPVGHPQAVATDEDTAVSFVPDATDVDGDVVNAIITTAPANGTIAIENGHLVYTPNLNFNGQDSLEYRPTDGSSTGGVAYVVIDVRSIKQKTPLG